jgi:hypothetical protein
MLNCDTFLWALLGSHGGAAFLENISPSVYRVHQEGIYSGKPMIVRALRRIESIRYLGRHFADNPELAVHYKRRARKLANSALKQIVKSGSFSYLPDFVRFAFKALPG